MTGARRIIAGQIIAGVGFRHACSAEELSAVVRRTEAAHGVAATALATLQAKAVAPALAAAAGALGLPVIAVTPDAVAAVQPLCPSRSAAALEAVGVAAVAEGCALAAAGPGAVLLGPRTTSAAATCALARGLNA